MGRSLEVNNRMAVKLNATIEDAACIEETSSANGLHDRCLILLSFFTASELVASHTN
jgi:hypothetical protein